MRSEIARHRNRPRCRPIAIAQDVGPTIGIEGQLEVRLRVWFKVTRVMLKKIRYTVWERLLKIVGYSAALGGYRIRLRPQ